MGRILAATASGNYILRVEFENGNAIVFNMRPFIKTLPYMSLQDPERFKDFMIEDKAIRWKDVQRPGQAPIRVRLTVDTMLFTIRE